MRRFSLPQGITIPILLLSLIVILMLGNTASEQPRIAPRWAVTQSHQWSQVPDIPLPDLDLTLGQFMQGTEVSIASASDLYSPADQTSLITEVEWALAYVANRFGHMPVQRVHIDVQRSSDCGLSGAAYTDQRYIQIFTCPHIPRNRVVNVLAHELVHQLAHDYYGARHLQTDMILLEGLATWGAGSYWLSGQPSFRAFVRQYQASEAGLLPLNTSYVGRPIADMNRLYYEWASFVEFLIETYGRDSFDALYVTGAKMPGSADYQGVYGKDLATLEQEWLTWLASGSFFANE